MIIFGVLFFFGTKKKGLKAERQRSAGGENASCDFCFVSRPARQAN